jgi:indole-3-glycerol phosphate synthase
MNILDQIIADQKILVEINKKNVPQRVLEASPYFSRPCHSLRKAMSESHYPAIIAEFKRKSPSKPDINGNADIHTIPLSYQSGGASAASILTNQKYFGGSDSDITEVRDSIDIPILRKEFIVDVYQLYESKSLGADAVLLIAEALDKESCRLLAMEAKALDLEVLMELHHESELSKINEHIDFIGINNRNLKNFNTTIEASLEMIARLPTDTIKISESGIQSPLDVVTLWQAGYRGFLIGERFMRDNNPGQTCASFIDTVKSLCHEN